jgi:hypothetical protein
LGNLLGVLVDARMRVAPQRCMRSYKVRSTWLACALKPFGSARSWAAVFHWRAKTL